MSNNPPMPAVASRANTREFLIHQQAGTLNDQDSKELAAQWLQTSSIVSEMPMPGMSTEVP